MQFGCKCSRLHSTGEDPGYSCFCSIDWYLLALLTYENIFHEDMLQNLGIFYEVGSHPQSNMDQEQKAMDPDGKLQGVHTGQTWTTVASKTSERTIPIIPRICQRAPEGLTKMEHVLYTMPTTQELAFAIQKTGSDNLRFPVYFDDSNCL